ncbi:MAG: cobalamin-binding domain-containing protein [Tissierellia bacterium]|nr:cobalamin-binding domain-containing protein [Tissierellia bacterium]
MKVLLVEAGYKNKYPPLGLMKISAYHKELNDEVVFVKGKNKEIREQKWDRIYVTTLFTFYWNKTIDVIKYYYNSIDNKKEIYIGGILATLLFEELKTEPGLEGITIISGLLDKPGILQTDNIIIDTLTPDYDIIDISKNNYLNYEYEVKNSYITSTTKGCIRNCKFCAVKTLEPTYLDYIDIKEQIKIIDKKYGEKRNLMLMDNNVLASNSLVNIVDDLIELGYGKGNKSYIKKSGNRTLRQTRYIDFNQGIDARLVNEENMSQLSRLEIKPLRIAFDHSDEKNVKIYVQAQKLAAKNGIKNLSNYILFNFKDTPEELYYRLNINIELNIEFMNAGFNTSIWSFPMKCMPISGELAKTRKYIGSHWNAKLLRGVQCVLNATHGVVGPKKAFFQHAFGSNFEEFIEILYMPELLITQRKKCEENGSIEKWKSLFRTLTEIEKHQFIKLIESNKFSEKVIINKKIKQLYSMYLIKNIDSLI